MDRYTGADTDAGICGGGTCVYAIQVQTGCIVHGVDIALLAACIYVLFLFDFCFWVGYPLFMEYVLKRKWFECTKEDYLALKYILTPWLIMEVIVMIYYYN